jgi:hypothetical protein
MDAIQNFLILVGLKNAGTAGIPQLDYTGVGSRFFFFLVTKFMWINVYFGDRLTRQIVILTRSPDWTPLCTR